jgi:hypothetical protein
VGQASQDFGAKGSGHDVKTQQVNASDRAVHLIPFIDPLTPDRALFLESTKNLLM